jgi:hypothetical protein
MHHRKLACLTFLILALFATSAAAAQSQPGADRNGFSVIAGYDGSYLYYVERTSPRSQKIDKDYGIMHGGFAQMRYDVEDAFFRLRGDASTTSRATYDGSLMNGTPYRASTNETIYKVELDAAYKLYNEDGITFSPYVGIGYRDWRRGENKLPSYLEDYSWWYGALGMNLNYRFGQWTAGLDAAVFLPFSMKMETDVAGLYDKTTFHIKPLPGVRVELPVGYEFHRTDAGLFSIFLMPYYEKWEIGKSPVEAMTRNGVPTGDRFYEPKSTTDIVGVRLGLGFHF